MGPGWNPNDWFSNNEAHLKISAAFILLRVVLLRRHFFSANPYLY